ncbi:MAG: methionyl-tRNA formyltransferase [Paracoccaceae bacterium]|jgi:methionyl-tRNA formyltransferase|nr:methionyl-tRNA formyltransferase [Marinovum sp.]MBT4230404.1 methionyl-tRNA formyltransferase [Paracoccaceae bacterium]MBF20432.1 methionyl-tRNA formyltransferase [Marinovum sp.]MBT4953416.1 methionyl-tRNA formyltransferase [Paracoccaceae bacterium]MBT5474707.1 methionyl-tRNA formyltransferase [Paracoccaceae bacterium]|tara:strand:+ start:3019 stop:3936 length:918 start_codon:yes stop_codon:yes gene_type:complete
MRLIFMGSPAFSVPVLEALVAAGHEIVAVYTQPPRPAGRGKKQRPCPVHARALALTLDVRHPASLKEAEEQAAFSELRADAAVVVAYGLLLPQELLDAPAHGCLNIHASLLPRWRGAAPIHRAIMAGDRETGICIMQMEAGLDTGPVLYQETISIAPDETTAALHERLSDLGARSIVQSLKDLSQLQARPQSSVGICYAQKIDKSEAQIDWSLPAEILDRQIRGLSPFPGAWAMLRGERVKFLGSALISCEQPLASAGTVLDDDLGIACGSGALRITRLQRAGKSAQSSAEFLRGTPVIAGEQLV